MEKNQPKLITKQDFLNYFKKPSVFWFLHREEIDHFFMDCELLEQLEEIKTQDLLALLREVDSTENLFFDNFIKLNKILNRKLIDFYKRKFSLPSLSIYDFSGSKDDNTSRILDLLKSFDDVFLFKPSLILEDLKISPTVIYKTGGKIYLIEHLWSFALKKETLGVLAYYKHVLDLFNLKIDQFFVSHLLKNEQLDDTLFISITPSLPFNAKKYTPEKWFDAKLKNVNTYFGLHMNYRKTLYEEICTEADFEFLNNDPWEIEPIRPEVVIDELRKFIKSPDRDVDFIKLSNIFLENRGKVMSSESVWFKFIFSNYFSDFEFSNSLIQFHQVLIKLMSIESSEKINHFLKFTSDLGFLDFPENQDYVVFERAISAFEMFKKIPIKVYYDFESVSFPYPYIAKIRPYTQIVLQLSLIKVVEGEEVKVVNEILDPLKLQLTDFKKIIDAIYVDEPNVAYVVYNKSFENTRLKEMAEFIGEEEYLQKVMEIIDRTVDLADWFRYGNTPYLIHKKLQGFHSIKKVVKLISRDIQEKARVTQYSDLKRCQNGIMAQALLVSRALSSGTKEDDKNWEKNKHFMISYCENDVRSMIAVEMLIEELLSQNKCALYDEDQFLREKLAFKRNP